MHAVRKPHYRDAAARPTKADKERGDELSICRANRSAGKVSGVIDTRPGVRGRRFAESDVVLVLVGPVVLETERFRCHGADPVGESASGRPDVRQIVVRLGVEREGGERARQARFVELARRGERRLGVGGRRSDRHHDVLGAIWRSVVVARPVGARAGDALAEEQHDRDEREHGQGSAEEDDRAAHRLHVRADRPDVVRRVDHDPHVRVLRGRAVLERVRRHRRRRARLLRRREQHSWIWPTNYSL